MKNKAYINIVKGEQYIQFPVSAIFDKNLAPSSFVLLAVLVYLGQYGEKPTDSAIARLSGMSDMEVAFNLMWLKKLGYFSVGDCELKDLESAWEVVFKTVERRCIE